MLFRKIKPMLHRLMGSPDGLHGKVFRSHLTIAMFSLPMLAVAILASSYLVAHIEGIMLTRVPAVQASLTALKGVQHSLAALRGWVALEDTAFKRERMQVWENTIRPQIAVLESMSVKWPDRRQQELVRQVADTLEDFYEIQWWIEDVVHTPGNRPGSVILEYRTRPIVDTIIENISVMLHAPHQKPGARHTRKMIATLADLRFQFTKCNDILNSRHVAGDPAFEEQFRSTVAEVNRIFDLLRKNLAALSKRQQQQLATAGREWQAFLLYADEVWSIRRSDKKNIARYMLATEAVPLARLMSDNLQVVVSAQQAALAEQAGRVALIGRVARVIWVLFAVAMIGVAIMLANKFTGVITQPIIDLTKAAGQMADGRLESLPVVGCEDEIGQLTRAFNQMCVELQRQTMELFDSHQRTRGIVESAAEGILTFEAGGHIEYVNPAIESICGYSEDELVGASISQLIPEDFCALQDKHSETNEERGDKEVTGPGRDTFAKRKDGTVFPIYLAVSEVKLRERKIYTCMITDISDRKQAESALQSSANKLAASNKELEDFAYIASHDLKEPLRGISNYSGFLMEDYADKLDDAGKQKLETLVRLAKNMEGLIDSLLYYSRVGRTEMAVANTNINEIIDNILESLEPVLQEREVEIRIPEPLPQVHCDRVRVQEVFRNLITNAMKYNDKEKKWIEIGAKDHTGGTKAFYVRDNGIGIREKHLEKVFKMFRRLHGKDKYGGGTGCGMTIVKKIVQRHGGDIWADSKYGEGTTFYFTLQLQEEDAERIVLVNEKNNSAAEETVPAFIHRSRSNS